MKFTNRFTSSASAGNACGCGVCLRESCQRGCAAPAMPSACSCGPNCGCGATCACNRASLLRDGGPA